MYKKNFGFSLLELMIAIFIMGILITVGFPSFIYFQKDANVETEARELVGALNKARLQSIKEGIPVYVYPVGLNDNWSSGWTSYINEVTTTYNITTNINVDNENNIAALKFDSRGRVFNGLNNNPINNINFLFCEGSDKSIQGRRVSINFLGRIKTELEECEE